MFTITDIGVVSGHMEASGNNSARGNEVDTEGDSSEGVFQYKYATVK